MNLAIAPEVQECTREKESQEVNRGTTTNAGGANAKHTGFTVGGPTDTSTVLSDVTEPVARAPTNRKQAEKGRGEGATAEFKLDLLDLHSEYGPEHGVVARCQTSASAHLISGLGWRHRVHLANHHYTMHACTLLSGTSASAAKNGAKVRMPRFGTSLLPRTHCNQCSHWN